MSVNKRGGLNITMIIQDECWSKLATFKWNTADQKKQYAILRSIEDAFGVKLSKKSDLNWAK